MARERRVKKKVSKNIATGVAHVNSSFNNTKILISDVQGNAIAWSSAGTWASKARGSRRLMPPRWLPKTSARRHRNMAFARWKSKFRARVRVVKARFVRWLPLVLTSRRSVT